MNLLTIIVFVLVIVLIYAVYKLMTKTTTTVSGFSVASQATTVTQDKLGSSPNFGFSVWVYIDAWQNTQTTQSGTDAAVVYKKNILTRCNGKTSIFQMYLDNEQNNLMLAFPGNPTTCTIQNVKLQKWFNVIMSVYGKEASDRLTPNSACTSGSTTATANMQLLPISIAHNAITSRRKAYRESMSSAGAGILLFISHPKWRQRNMQTQTVLHCRT